MLERINKFQLGGLASITDLVIDMLSSGQEETVMLALDGLSQMGKLANAVVLEIALRAEQGEEKAVAAVQILEQAMLAKQQQVTKHLNGAKLNYIKKLLGICNDDEEIVYFKAGGRVWSKCVKKQKVEKEACGRKIKKHTCGGTTKTVKGLREKIAQAKCGKKLKKCGEGDGLTAPMQKAMKTIEDNNASVRDRFSYDKEARLAGAVADRLKAKYPNLSHDLRAGREYIEKNGKAYYMNGDGNLIYAGVRNLSQGEVKNMKNKASKYSLADTEKCGGKLKKKKC